ncbi:MAG: ATP-binding cassette domain-containing protein [Pseudomonadota bacterium]
MTQSASTETRTPATSVSLARRLWSDYLARYWPKLALALIAMGAYAASASAIPAGVEWINAGFTGEQAAFSPSLNKVLIFGPLIVIGLGAVNAFSQYLQVRLSAGAALGALRDMQNDMFARLMAMDFAQQRQEASGQVISRFTNDTMVLRETLRRVSNAVRDVLTLLGLGAMMIYYDWVLFLVVLSIYPLIGVPVARIGKILRRTSAGAQKQAGDLTAFVGETMQGARMVKTYQIEPLEKARAADAFETRFKLLQKMAYTRAANEPFIFFAGSVALGVVVAVVAMRISAGALSTSEFVGFIIALLLLSQPARGLGTLNAVAQEGFAAFERMLDIIDARPSIVSAEGAAALPLGPGRVAFERVSFSYRDGEAALNDVSLDIPAGRMAAIVGESGAGKSTLLNLLPRLYEPTKGRILIDGHDISKATLRSLRERMALVSQDAIVFNMSALENIAFGRPGASRAEIIEAAEAAAANEFIAALPNGYDTPLGEGGSALSGGQRQRIALARAFLKDAPILLLDEATSALDAESEAKIQEALSRLTKGRTSIVIAHRLSTVKDADMIIVMEKGRIIESGTHDALIEKGGAYARQAGLQLA